MISAGALSVVLVLCGTAAPLDHCDEEFLRNLSDLSLTRALADLDAIEPPSPQGDPATKELRAIARARVDIRHGASTPSQRDAAMDAIRAARERLIQSFPHDPRVETWLCDAAEDELVLGFLGNDAGAQALAGTPGDGVYSRAHELLQRVLALLKRADSADRQAQSHAAAIDGPISQRLKDDREVRRPLLEAMATAFELAINRAINDPIERSRVGAHAAKVLATLDSLRGTAPLRLRNECDLAAVAAAAACAQSESARFGAARIALAGDAMAYTLARILAADALLNERRSREALEQMTPLVSAAGLPTEIRLLSADAFVRMRTLVGRSPTSQATLDPWISVFKTASNEERAAIRTALLGRIGATLKNVRIDGPLPEVAEIALARVRLLEDATDGSSLRSLQKSADSSEDAQIAGLALIALADVHLHHNQFDAAARDLLAFASVVPRDRLAGSAQQVALDIELAIDAQAPDSSPTTLRSALEAAVARESMTDSLASHRAQLAALNARERIALLLSAMPAPDQTASAQWADAASTLSKLSSSSKQSTPAATRVSATVLSLQACADLLRADAKTPLIGPATLQPSTWTSMSQPDACTLALLRLVSAARNGRPGPLGFKSELASMPATLDETIFSFIQRSHSTPQRALDACIAWEERSPKLAAPALASARARIGRDLACLAGDWTSAVTRARNIANSSDFTLDDRCRLMSAIWGAIQASAPANGAPSRDELLMELITVAREVSTEAQSGSAQWWLAQAMQVEVAQSTGRGGEPILAKIARLRTIDPNLGTTVSRPMLESAQRNASGQ